MRRRDFITILGCAAATWPRTPRAQQQDGRLRRIGILSIYEEADAVNQLLQTSLRESLAKLGWVENRNVRFDARYAAADRERLPAYADDLVRSAPDLLVVGSSTATRVLQYRTKAIPIVFVNVGDPVAGGLVTNVARPEGNMTGFTNLYGPVAGKWLELLKEVAPQTVRVALIFDREIVAGSYLATVEASAKTLAVKVVQAPYGDPTELERSIDAFASEPNGALMILPPPAPVSYRALLARLALKHRLPTVHPDKSFTVEGGLMSYSADASDAYRAAAAYIDRILRGTKVSDLPVQFPTKYELVINLKTAKAIGLTIPEAVLLRADQLIE